MAHPLIDRITRFRKINVRESESRYRLYPPLKEMCDSLPFDTPILINLDDNGEIKPEILANPVDGWRIWVGTGVIYLSVLKGSEDMDAAKDRAAASMRALVSLGAILGKYDKDGATQKITGALTDFTSVTIWESAYRFKMNPSHADVFSMLPAGTCYFVTLKEDGSLDGKILGREMGGLRVKVSDLYVYLSISENEIQDELGKKKILELHSSLMRATFYLPSAEDMESLRRPKK